MSPLSLYDILGIDASASDDDVRKAYKRKALATHPDKLEPAATRQERLLAEAQFREICEAFETLGNPHKRKAYDIFRRHSRNRPSEHVLRRMEERQIWARQQEEEHKLRMAAIKAQQQSEELNKKELEAVSSLVKEMADALNEAIPGWLERKRKVEQVERGFRGKKMSARV